MTNTALDNVMAQAQEAAANYVPPQLVTAPAQLPVAANNNQAIARPTMAAVLDGGFTVDEYLTNQQGGGGFKISKDMKGLLEEIIVEIDMSEVTPVTSARFETNGATKFFKTYDGVSTATGENFAFACAQAAAIPGTKSSGTYQTVEIPATLLEDVEDPSKTSNLVVHAGTVVGITPSMTGFAHFQKFYKRLAKENPALLQATLKVRVSNTDKANKNGNKWSVCDFELIEVLS